MIFYLAPGCVTGRLLRDLPSGICFVVHDMKYVDREAYSRVQQGEKAGIENTGQVF